MISHLSSLTSHLSSPTSHLSSLTSHLSIGFVVAGEFVFRTTSARDLPSRISLQNLPPESPPLRMPSAGVSGPRGKNTEGHSHPHGCPASCCIVIMLSRVSSLLPKQLPLCRFSGGYFSHRPTADNNESVPFEFTAETMQHVNEVMGRYPEKGKKSAMIPLLTLAQKQNDNFLSLNAMKKVAKMLEINEMDVYEVATFYTMFNRSRVGKFHLQVCGTTPCMLRGAEKIIEACEKHLGIREGQTTQDGLFTIQEVECLGACANAPMIQVNGEWVYEDLTPENTVQLLEDLKAGRDRKGPQIERNCAEGPEGRTSLTNEGGEHLPTHSRDFAKAKVEWEEAEKKRVEEEKKKAEEAKRVEEEKRAQAAKKI